MRYLLTAFLLLASVTVFGQHDLVSCTAKVALNRVFKIELNRTTRELKVVSDNGFRYEGSGSFAYSPRTEIETYYLPLAPPVSGSGLTGLTVQLERGGPGRIAFCLQPNECYLCR